MNTKTTKPSYFHPTYDEFKKKRPVWTTNIRRGIEYSVFRFGLFLAKKLTIKKLQNLGRGLGKIGYLFLHKDRGIVKKQLKLIFPEIDEITREIWAKECFSHFGQMFFEFLCLPQILKEESKLLQIENEKVIKKAIDDKKGVILLAMHSGNWELISAYAKRSGIKMMATTTNFPDSRINMLIQKQREHDNLKILRRGTSESIKKMWVSVLVWPTENLLREFFCDFFDFSYYFV